MKSTKIFGITIFLLVVLAGILIVSVFDQPAAFAQELNSSAMRARITSTPVAEDQSVIGSTDGIVAMGVLIVLIVVTPMLLRRKKK